MLTATFFFLVFFFAGSGSLNNSLRASNGSPVPVAELVVVTEFAVAVVVAELVVGAETFDFTTEPESRGEIDGTSCRGRTVGML